MEKLFGIYEAIVTDNSSFFNNGMIKVRVQEFYNEKLNWNLSVGYNATEFEKDISDDMFAFVHTPIGGGANYGLFSVPQINSNGIVQFLDGDFRKPIWMGSFFKQEKDSNGLVKSVNIPNDIPSKEMAGSEGIRKTGDENYPTKKINGGIGTISLRTKQTKAPGSERKPENMDFDKNRTENIFSLSEKELRLAHYSKWKEDSKKESAELEQYEEIHFSNDESTGEPLLSIKVEDKASDNKNTTVSKVLLSSTSSSLTYSSNKTKITSEIKTTSEGVSISTSNSNNKKITTYNMTPEKVTINNKTVTIVISDSDVAISAPDGKVRISGSEVLLGDGGGYVLVRDTPMLPFRTEDGSVLKTTNVRA